MEEILSFAFPFSRPLATIPGQTCVICICEFVSLRVMYLCTCVICISEFVSLCTMYLCICVICISEFVSLCKMYLCIQSLSSSLTLPTAKLHSQVGPIRKRSIKSEEGG